MSKDYGSWSLQDLKNELRRRNAKTTGKKAVLVQRLEDYDQLFGPLITDPENVFKIVTPTAEHFRDITSDTQMPPLDIGDMELFCQLTERNDIEKSKNMYEEHFLLSCRLATKDTEYYITGVVASEMRKNITYNVTVKVRHHLILEAQCECAAGMGPYAQCKHILVLILGVIEMSKNKTIKMRGSVTSMLQTFHQPHTLYSGTPVKAEDLILKHKVTKLQSLKSFDPRPTEYTETSTEFNKRFKNAVANYCGQSKESATMPMAQIIKPADKKSIYKDHDYLNKTMEEVFLDEWKLSNEERRILEEVTRNNKKLWKQERVKRIHSSHFGSICKSLNGKKLAESLVKNSDILTPAIKHGLKYEDEAAEQFENKTKIKTKKCGIVVHETYQFLASTPDRLVGNDGVLEIKCPYTAKGKNISPETVPYLYLCEKTGQIKLDEEHNYFYQVQGQLLCTQRDVAYFCVYTISDFIIINIPRNNGFIEKMFVKLEKFYYDYFMKVILKRFLYNKK